MAIQTNIENINLNLFSKSLGYKKYFYLNDKKNKQNYKKFLKFKEPLFLKWILK